MFKKDRVLSLLDAALKEMPFHGHQSLACVTFSPMSTEM